VVDNEFEPEEIDGQEVENSFLRRIVKIMTLPTVKLSKKGNQWSGQDHSTANLMQSMSVRRKKAKDWTHDSLSEKVKKYNTITMLIGRPNITFK
jgi:hypothetical protein